MSINWVMLDPQKEFVRLPGEKPIYKSPPRITLALTTPKTYPANNPVSIHSDSGTVYLTNQRVVYLAAKPVGDFQSFSAPLINLHDTHVTVPWFGPNAWIALVQPVPGGNLPAVSTGIELKLTFKEGGAPEFHSNFERIKERLRQALDTSNQGRGTDGFAQINLDTVHLDQLPTYEASGADPVAQNSDLAEVESPQIVLQTFQETQPVRQSHVTTDAPPGYEETQQSGVQRHLDRMASEGR